MSESSDATTTLGSASPVKKVLEESKPSEAPARTIQKSVSLEIDETETETSDESDDPDLDTDDSEDESELDETTGMSTSGATTTEPGLTTSGATTTDQAQVHRVKVNVENAPDSQDSEGLVVEQKKSSDHSLNPHDHILIVVADFRGEKGARFMEDKGISNIYVEYNFLDVPQEELETPFSLPKPKLGEKITFNFSKLISFERGVETARRRTLTRILKGEARENDKDRTIRFCVVSEPSDSDPDLECEEIGAGVLDVCRLDRDLVDHTVHVRDDKGTLVGELTITVKSAALVKSLNI